MKAHSWRKDKDLDPAFDRQREYKRIRIDGPAAATDLYEQYISTDRLHDEEAGCDEAIAYWLSRYNSQRDLARFALDLFAVSPMSDKCERLFSSAKLGIVDRRGRLKADIIEACECLRAWYGKPRAEDSEDSGDSENESDQSGIDTVEEHCPNRDTRELALIQGLHGEKTCIIVWTQLCLPLSFRPRSQLAETGTNDHAGIFEYLNPPPGCAWHLVEIFQPNTHPTLQSTLHLLECIPYFFCRINSLLGVVFAAAFSTMQVYLAPSRLALFQALSSGSASSWSRETPPFNESSTRTKYLNSKSLSFSFVAIIFTVLNPSVIVRGLTNGLTWTLNKDNRVVVQWYLITC
ncbi:ribonuclease H-like protein [Hirsutella rhossiliensis]